MKDEAENPYDNARRRLRDALSASAPYEPGETNSSFTFALYPVYLRGEAYLAAKPADCHAVNKFQKILGHPGVVALARLGLGRAYAQSGDSAKSKSAY
jgi:hypothetical protein